MDERTEQRPTTEQGAKPQKSGVRFFLDVNHQVTGKVKKRFYHLHTNFATERLTVAGLADVLTAGQAYTSPFAKVKDDEHATSHYKTNVLEVSLLWLDVETEDERSTLDWWLNEPLVRDHAAIIHTTASHTDGAPRCRILFVLDEPLDIPGAEAALKALMYMYPFVDQSVHDAGRVLYGAKDCELRLLGNTLSLDVLHEEVVKPYLDHLDEEQRQHDAERAKRPARPRNTKANAGRWSAYVQKALDEELAAVAGAKEGTGLRHVSIRDGSLSLYSLQKADWLDDEARRLLDDLEEQLLDAARASDYVAKYGEADTRRIIAGGRDMAKPALEPVSDFSDFFQPGDVVVATAGPRQAQGQVTACKQDEEGAWIYELEGAWWPRSTLCHATVGTSDELPSSDELDAPEDDPDDVNSTFVHQEDTGDAVSTGKPPPPPNWTDDCPVRPIHHVKVPKDKYLADVALELPERAVLDANTGIGKTTFAATCGRPGERVIVAMSSIVALRQQAMKYEDAALVYEHEKTLTPVSKLAFVTYDQLPAVARMYEEWQVDFTSVRLFVDEQHNLALAGYRRRTLAKLLDMVDKYDWKSVTFMSGTPLDAPHSALADFEYVKVDSHRRTQRSVLVRWKDGEGEGRKRDTIVKLVKRHKRVLVHLDNKGRELDGLVATLVASGVDLSTIYTLNADNKFEPLGQQVTEHETVPDDCRVLIVTSVFVESSNMQTRFDAGIIATPIHPSYAQQFANRQRGEVPMDAVYVLHNGTGKGWGFNIKAELDHTQKLAQKLADTLNDIEDSRATISEDARRVFGGEYGALVGRKGERFEVDELGVAQHVHQSAALYANQNATCYKNMTRPYNWRWLEDEELVVTEADKPDRQRKQERELSQEYADLAKTDWQSRVAFIHELGPGPAENERYLGKYHSKLLRVIERALALYDLTEDWTNACALLATATDSTQSYNKLKRLVAADKLRATGDVFAQTIQDAFELDKPYTRNERHQRLLEVYKGHESMRPFVTEVYKYSWSQEPTAKLDKRTGDDILRLLFTVTEQRVRVDGEQVRRWTMTGHEPLEERLSAGRTKLELATDKLKKANAVPANYVFIKDKNKFSGTADHGEARTEREPAPVILAGPDYTKVV